MSRRGVRVAAVGIALALLLPDASIAQGAAGRTAQGLDYVSGGVSLDEREALDAPAEVLTKDDRSDALKGD